MANESNPFSAIVSATQEVQKTWNHPVSQITLTLVQDPEFKSALNQIVESKKGNQVLGLELALIIVLWTIRAWRLGQAATWLRRLWVQAYLALLFWLSALFLVPVLVWGEAYRTVIGHGIRAILKVWFA